MRKFSAEKAEFQPIPIDIFMWFNLFVVMKAAGFSVFLIIFFQLAVGKVMHGSDIAPFHQDFVGQSKDDTSEVNLLNRMAMSLRESDHEVALKYAEDALALATRINYLKGQAAALGSIGWVYYRKSNYVESLHHSIEAMKISEQIGDKGEMARSMNNIAAVSFEQKQFDKALSEFKRALAFSYASGDETVTGRTLNNISYIFLTAQNNIDSAEYYGKRALAFSEKIKDSYLVSFALRTLGDVLAKKKRYAEALEAYRKAVAMSETGLNSSMKAATNHRIARAYVAMNRSEEAIRVLEQNAEEAQQKGYLEELERTYKLLSEIYHQQGKTETAYSFLLKYTVMHDSLYNQQRNKQIALLQNQFDLDLKEAQIDLLTKDATLKQEEIANQRVQLYATILAGSCVLLLVVVMLYSYQKVKRTNGELQVQKEELAWKNVEVVEKSNELSLLNTTKDKLLSIIGHDFRSPLQSLKGILQLIGNKNMTQAEFERYSKELLRKIDSVYNNLDNILTWSVSQLNGIQTHLVRVNPSQLVNEVFELYAEMAQVKNVFLTNDVSESIELAADKDQIRLVIRNLVSNALKFTTADGYVRVGGYRTENDATIFVQDSGVGIASSDLQKLFVKESLWSVKGTNNEKGMGLGLLLCKEFVEKNNGSLDIKSEQGAGTTISFTLPCPDTSIRIPDEPYLEGLYSGKD